MTGLLVFKDKLKFFYGKYDRYITMLIKFLLGFLAFTMLNQNIGFMTKLKNPLVPLLLGLVCSWLPYGAITFLAAVFMLTHLYAISLEMTLIALAFMLIIGILYYGFQPGDSFLLLVTPILFWFKIPYMVPLLVGLSGGLTCVIPVSTGVFLYYAMQYVKQNAGVLTNETSVDLVQKYAQIINSLLSNQLMLVMVAAFAISILVVFLIRNLSIDYAWMFAIIAGTVTQLGVIFIGDFVFNVSVPMVQLILGAVLSVLLAGVYDFMFFSVDYSRTEYTQFEDDDYYYYVKAVPKLTVSAPDVKVQKISIKKSSKGTKTL